MLRGVGVDHVEAGGDVVDEDDPGLLPAEAVRTRSACLVCGTRRSSALATSAASRSLSVTRTEAAYGSCSSTADEVGGDVLGVGAVVGEHGDLGGPGLGVDADEALSRRLAAVT